MLENEAKKNMNVNGNSLDKLILSALDGYAVFNSNTVTVSNDDGESIQLSKSEWEMFRKDLCFDDTVDYKIGETPMTVYQFNTCVELYRRTKCLEAEIENIATQLVKG